MLIVGAKGHAKEILDVLIYNNYPINDLFFFDDVSNDLPKKLHNRFNIIRTSEELVHYFKTSPVFILATGNIKVRQFLYEKMVTLGGQVESIIAKSAIVSEFDVKLGVGINIMHNVLVSSSVRIGLGSLINASSTIHHDAVIGEFCEISPNVTITGNVTVGSHTYIGSGAIILPNITIGENVIIGAGAVVTKNISNNCKVVGIPAR